MIDGWIDVSHAARASQRAPVGNQRDAPYIVHAGKGLDSFERKAISPRYRTLRPLRFIKRALERFKYITRSQDCPEFLRWEVDGEGDHWWRSRAREDLRCHCIIDTIHETGKQINLRLHSNVPDPIPCRVCTERLPLIPCINCWIN